jgi:transcriptional regulator with XRE-family HTH domain
MDPVIRAAFASVIRQLRRKLRISQRRVAELSGYSEKYIGLLERRKNTPSLTSAIMVSIALGQDPIDTLKQVRSLMSRSKRLEAKDPEAADI